MVDTHSLVMDFHNTSFSIAEGTEAEMQKQFRSWRTKIFGAKAKAIVVKLPTPDGLPAEYRRSAILGIRIVRIPEEELYRRRITQDPRNQRFVENANHFDSKIGSDMLDEGYKR